MYQQLNQNFNTENKKRINDSLTHFRKKDNHVWTKVKSECKVQEGKWVNAN